MLPKNRLHEKTAKDWTCKIEQMELLGTRTINIACAENRHRKFFAGSHPLSGHFEALKAGPLAAATAGKFPLRGSSSGVQICSGEQTGFQDASSISIRVILQSLFQSSTSNYICMIALVVIHPSVDIVGMELVTPMPGQKQDIQ